MAQKSDLSSEGNTVIICQKNFNLKKRQSASWGLKLN